MTASLNNPGANIPPYRNLRGMCSSLRSGYRRAERQIFEKLVGMLILFASQIVNDIIN